MEDLKLRLEKLKARLKTAEKVSKTLHSKGFKHIQGLIDRAIEDTDAQMVSKKKGNVWHQGLKATPKEIESGEYYQRLFYYKQALIDINNRVWAYDSAIDNIKTEITKLETGQFREEEKSPYKYWGNDSSPR